MRVEMRDETAGKAGCARRRWRAGLPILLAATGCAALGGSGQPAPSAAGGMLAVLEARSLPLIPPVGLGLATYYLVRPERRWLGWRCLAMALFASVAAGFIVWGSH